MYGITALQEIMHFQTQLHKAFLRISIRKQFSSLWIQHFNTKLMPFLTGIKDILSF